MQDTAPHSPPARPVVTRFAPSPTGFLHIGGARTALFNWLFARKAGGRFVLRIEDTDRARSTDAARRAILDGLSWLGLDWDGAPISQFSRAARHVQVARALLAQGGAYKCFASPQEIATAREAARAQGLPALFQSPWRDTPARDHPAGRPFVIRLRAPREGETVIEDRVQGRVVIGNAHLDDMVLVRADATPTYMLAVVVDDHDMHVSHVIRGDDHLNNAARQMQIYAQMGWEPPIWAHIPLIHGTDGKKLSKRHGALSVEEYAAMGYPAAAVRNYLARLGWSHGNDEFFTDAQALEWFGFAGMGKAPARLDLKKIDHLSGRHLATMDAQQITRAVDAYLCLVGDRRPLCPARQEAFLRALPHLRKGVRNLSQMIEKAAFVFASRPIAPDSRAAAALTPQARALLQVLTLHLQNARWSRKELEAAVAAFTGKHGVTLGQLAPAVRAALAGRSTAPSVFDMMVVLGRLETLGRLNDAQRDWPSDAQGQ